VQPRNPQVWRSFAHSGVSEERARGGFWIEAAFFLSLAACLLLNSCAVPPSRVVAAIFFLAPAANALTIALIHALDNSRYRGSYGPLLLFALAGMLVFIVTTLTYAAVPAFRRKTRDQFAATD
jgi:hypothetical protein